MKLKYIQILLAGLLLCFAIASCTDADNKKNIVFDKVDTTVGINKPTIEDTIRAVVLDYVNCLDSLNKGKKDNFKKELFAHYTDKVERYYRKLNPDRAYMKSRVDSISSNHIGDMKAGKVYVYVNKNRHSQAIFVVESKYFKGKKFFFSLKLNDKFKIYSVRNYQYRDPDKPEATDEIRVEYIHFADGDVDDPLTLNRMEYQDTIAEEYASLQSSVVLIQDFLAVVLQLDNVKSIWGLKHSKRVYIARQVEKKASLETAFGEAKNAVTCRAVNNHFGTKLNPRFTPRAYGKARLNIAMYENWTDGYVDNIDYMLRHGKIW